MHQSATIPLQPNSTPLPGGAIRLGTYSREHLGDALCTSTLPRMLAEKFGAPVYAPDHPTARAVFKHNPYVNGFAIMGTPLCQIARGNGHVIQRIAQGFELPLEPLPKPELYLTRAEKIWAYRTRRKWSRRRPVCVLSSAAVTDAENLERVDWRSIVKVLSRRYTVVQPLVRERAVPGALVYRNLPLRRYMALVSVADLFVGGTSGGSHVAAAFQVPALIVIWRELYKELRFPISGGSFKSQFLYPQHSFICAEDLGIGSFDYDLFEIAVGQILRDGRSGTLNAIGSDPRHPCGFAPVQPKRVLQTSSRRFVRVPGRYGEIPMSESDA